MATVLNAAARLRGAIHDNYPRGGGSMWRILAPRDRAKVLEKFPHRTDLDINAPYEVRPPHREWGSDVRQSRENSRSGAGLGLRAPGRTYIERTAPQD